MELELHRVDLLQTTTTMPGTMAVLRPGAKKTQKVVVGDTSGVVQCFSVKKGEVSLAFKTLPTNQKVTSITLGRHPKQRDRIFFGAGNTIKGVSKQGKEFFRFNTNLTEALRHLCVSDRNIWTCCEFVHSHFVESSDKGMYLSPDRINAAELMPMHGPLDFVPVLACQDRTIRIFDSMGALQFEVSTESPPTALRYVIDSHDPQHRHPNAKELLYGTEDGRVVQLLLDGNDVREGFTIKPPVQMRRNASSGGMALGAVRSIHCGADYSKSGCADIVVGRDDGTLEVWDIDESCTPHRVYDTKLRESITTVDGGYVTNATTPDIIVQTFSGKIIAYTASSDAFVAPSGDRAAMAQRTAAQEHMDVVQGLNARIVRLTAEVEELRDKVQLERNKYAAQSESLVANQSTVSITNSLRLLFDERCFALAIESPVPIFTVALQANVPLHLIEVPTNVAILSRCPPDERAGSPTLATYRCQDSTTRLSIKFNAREGRPGQLQAFLIPSQPPKTCSIITHRIKPLCLHERTQMTVLDEGRPYSELTITGNYTLAQVHTWVAATLPDVPPNLTPGEPSVLMLFQNCELGTQLSCKYQDGQALFVSDSISALSVLHETLMREATSSKCTITSSFSLDAKALQHCLALLWPALEQQRSLVRKVQLLEALQELKIQDGDTGHLAPEYRSMLDQADKLRTGLQQQPEALEAATDAVRGLFRDYARLSGGRGGVKAMLTALEAVLKSTDNKGAGSMDAALACMLGKQ